METVNGRVREMSAIRRTGKMGLCLVAVFAIAAMAASSASAAEYEVAGLPEFGRCVKSEPAKTGEYVGSSCVAVAAGHKGGYNWLPGPGEKSKFTSFAGLVKLETVGGVVIACSNGTLSGTYKDPKTLTATLAVLGCVEEATGKLCQTNPAKNGEIEATGLEGELGYIVGGSKPKVGLQLKLTTPVAFECHTGMELPSPKVLEGSFIGKIGPIDKMHETFKATYTAVHGKQVPEKFEEGVPSTLILKDVLSGKSEQAGITIIGIEEKPKALIIENEERLEIKAK
jgi:hypothetical protein